MLWTAQIRYVWTLILILATVPVREDLPSGK